MIQKINLILSSCALIGITIIMLNNRTSNDKIAYIDTRKLVESYKDMKSITAQYQEKSRMWQERIDILTNELQQEISKYEEERKKMNLEEQANREKYLAAKQREIAEYHQKVQEKSRMEDDEDVQAMIAKINNFILEYGKEHNYRMILAANGNNLAYADKGLDITEELIAELNHE